MAGAFFLAELGDKTMLTTAGLAADRGAIPVWIGSFAAMMAATALAVLAGQALTSRVRARHAAPRRRHRVRRRRASAPSPGRRRLTRAQRPVRM